MKYLNTRCKPQNLGLLLQRAYDKRYADLLSEKIWQKVAQDDASVVLDSEKIKCQEHIAVSSNCKRLVENRAHYSQ
ncbi:MAG: hypothetical protein Ct9H90mP13_06690 [Pseudomonadota bacterium]|nr:MAG: hypothetical protein Ct9H90mP13_06690 [Pseudomonadota bacterium]